MKMYTAGYTGHDGYPVTLAEGDSIEDVVLNLPFEFDAVKFLNTHGAGKDAIPKIVEAIQKEEGVSGWVRQAPYTVLVGHAEDHESYTVSYRVSGSSLEDVTRALLHRSVLFAIEVDNRVDGSGIKDEVMEVFVGSLSIGVYVTTSDTGFDITGISLGSEFSSSDVKMLAIMYANPGDDASHAVLIMSPTAEVEDAAQQVKHAENARLKAVRRAADEGVSQRVLAKMTGVSQATIGRWLKED